MWLVLPKRTFDATSQRLSACLARGRRKNGSRSVSRTDGIASHRIARIVRWRSYIRSKQGEKLQHIGRRSERPAGLGGFAPRSLAHRGHLLLGDATGRSRRTHVQQLLTRRRPAFSSGPSSPSSSSSYPFRSARSLARAPTPKAFYQR